MSTETTPAKDNGQVFWSKTRGQIFYLHAWEVSIVGGTRPNTRDFQAPGHALADPDATIPVDMSLVESIKMRGQRVPIEVRKEPAPEGVDLRAPVHMPAEVVAVTVFGRQRLKAIDYINASEGWYGTPNEILVSCIHVARGTTAQDVAEDSMIENGQRREVRAFAVIEKARAYLNTFGDDDETLARCAVANRLSVKRLRQLLDFAESAPPQTLKALKKGEIGVGAALELSKLPAEKQIAMLEKGAVKGDGKTPKKISASAAKKAAAAETGERVRPGLKEIKAYAAELGEDHEYAPVLAWVLGLGDKP